MGIRFSKSIKLGNYLRLNLSKSGVSATVGKRGASVTLSKRGTFLNLSPSAVGVKGTGLSYRQKISSNTIGKLFGEKDEKEAKENGTAKTTALSGKKESSKAAGPEDVIAAYEENMEARIRIHRYAEPVPTREAFDRRIEESASEAGKELYELCLQGDEDTIENFLGAFMNHLDLPYDVRVNYELEDETLYADMDLPEIEDLGTDHPVIAKGKIVSKKKTAAELREEYAKTVLSLGVFMGASFFCVSPTIKYIVLSGFTTVRNHDGDPVDKYLYSVKFARDVFEQTDLSALEDLRAFYLQFENRLNLSVTNVFKAVKPYERGKEDEKAISDPVLEDALMALMGLGFPGKSVRAIEPELRKKSCTSASEYVKEGLKLLSREEST